MYKSELARHYGVSVGTIKKMLELTRQHYINTTDKDVLGEYKGRGFLSIKQVKLFIEHNDKPD